MRKKVTDLSNTNRPIAKTKILDDEDVFSRVPQLPSDLAAFSRLIGAKFLDFLERDLPEDKYHEFLESGLRLNQECQSKATVDRFILEQAETLGVRLLFDPQIVYRLLQWQEYEEETEGPEMLAKFWKNVELCAKIRRGLAKQSVSKDHYPFRLELISELRTLRDRTSIELSRNRRAAGIEDIATLVEDEIGNNIDSYERLGSNKTAFLTFLRQNPYQAHSFWNRELRPQSLANEYLAWSMGGRDPETLRQQISHLRPHKNSRRPKSPNL